MHEHPDEDLRQLFERARTPLAAEAFLAALDARLAAAQRRAQRRRAVAVALGVALAAALALVAAPLLTHLSLAVGAESQGASARLGAALASPGGWGLALALALLLLRRSGALGR
ncbi:MAG TPA: hypothetical protein VMU67_10030 [Steroidobacteraceae bacterium]|nr:hypothetical protein [Steroidobacteraceae bacterium]